MHAWLAVLDAGDMQKTMHQVYLLPSQRAQFGRVFMSERRAPMPKAHMTMPILARLDLLTLEQTA